MSSILLSALSQESDYANLTVEGDETADLELEKDSGEIARLETAVSQAELEQEELESAESTMEGIVASLESAIDDEVGMTAREANAYRLAFRASVGYALPNPVTTLESECGDTERMEASVLSMEGIKETAKKIWEAIKRAVSNAIKAVADFFAKIFGGAKKLKEKLEKVQKDIEEAKKENHQLTDGKLETTTGVSNLFYDGKSDIKSILKGLEVVKESQSSTEELVNGVDDLYKNIADALKSRKEDKEAVAKAVSTSQYVKAAGKSQATVVIPGDKLVMITGKNEEGYIETKDADGEEIKTMMAQGNVPKLPKLKIANTPRVTKPKDLSVGAVTLDELLTLVTGAIELVDKITKSKDTKDKIKKAREEVIKEAESLQKDAEKLAEKAEGFWTNAQIKAHLKLANMDASSAIAKFDGYMFSYCRSVEQFASSAVKEFKKAA